MEVYLSNLRQLDTVLGTLYDEVIERVVESVDEERVVACLRYRDDGGGKGFDVQYERVIELELAGVKS